MRAFKSLLIFLYKNMFSWIPKIRREKKRKKKRLLLSLLYNTLCVFLSLQLTYFCFAYLFLKHVNSGTFWKLNPQLRHYGNKESESNVATEVLSAMQDFIWEEQLEFPSIAHTSLWPFPHPEGERDRRTRDVLCGNGMGSLREETKKAALMYFFHLHEAMYILVQC